jgi:hypothetical protein
MQEEWGTYVERFKRLPKEVQEKRVKKQGYESFRDMLAHILAWWEEGMEIIHAVVQEREFERKKYDFDVFNAEAVARYKPWDEAEFMTHFERTRRQMEADLKSMNDAAFEHRRVKAWLRGIVFSHAREHLVTVSRFQTISILENEWAEYIENFSKLDTEKQKEFLAKQGFGSFHDLLAHIVGWWEEGARIISGILASPGFTWVEHDTDQFNAELTKKYVLWADDDLFKHYETVRLALIELVETLPEDAFLNKDIEDWLAADVIEHYDEHPLPA